MIKLIKTIALLIVPICFAAPVMAQDQIHKDKAWVAYKDKDDRGRKLCYMTSIPEQTTTSQKVNRRGDTALIVTHRPFYGIEGQVEVKLGFPGNEGKGATISVDGRNSTKLFIKGETAWSYDDISDQKLVGMMRRGNKLLLTSTSRRGTVLKDTYSLMGFTAAYNSITKACN